MKSITLTVKLEFEGDVQDVEAVVQSVLDAINYQRLTAGIVGDHDGAYTKNIVVEAPRYHIRLKTGA